MSNTGYYRSVIEDTYDWAAERKYVLNNSSVNSLYLPRETDIITVSAQLDNIKCWTVWDTSAKQWEIHISDLSFVGKVYYRLQARSY